MQENIEMMLSYFIKVKFFSLNFGLVQVSDGQYCSFGDKIFSVASGHVICNCNTEYYLVYLYAS